MIFRVSLVSDTPEFETLPVAKITQYPLEKADYKPFAQCCLCITPNALALRMWAFEVNTCPESELRAVLRLYPSPEKVLHIKITPPCTPSAANELSVWLEENGVKTLLESRSNPHNGEDLQGVYWGSDIFIPLSQLGETLALKSGTSFPGNFYKIRTGESFAHSGSFAPAAFPQDPFGPDSMAVFQIVSY